MEKTNTQTRELVSTKSVFIYPSERANCGIIPDENGLIYHFGETKELYPPKYIKILVNNTIDKIDIANALRNFADILEGKKEVQYEAWLIEQSKEADYERTAR